MEVLEYLAAGGDLAMMALLYIMWRFDRRLVKIETIIQHSMGRGDGKAKTQT
jgi:hypothetical protein